MLLLHPKEGEGKTILMTMNLLKKRDRRYTEAWRKEIIF